MKNACLLLLLTIMITACNNDQYWGNLGNGFKDGTIGNKPATIETSDFKNGQLRITGCCGKEGEILLVLPITKGDDRIVGSPKCHNGRYEVITSTFGRPPCQVEVLYDGDRSVRAEVQGTDIYCP